MDEFEKLSIKGFSEGCNEKWVAFFRDEEVKQIKKDREQYDKLIHDQPDQMEIYLKYIVYERKLLKTIQNKRTAIQQHKRLPSKDVERSIARKMKILYDHAVAVAPQERILWEEYVKFLILFKFPEEVSAALEKMIKFHNQKLDVWLRALKWELVESPDYSHENITSLLYRCQLQHSQCKDLYEMFIKNQSTSKPIDYDLILSIMAKVQKIFIETKSKYGIDLESISNTLAQKELQKNRSIGLDNASDQIPDLNIINCVQVYEMAVKRLNTELMWDFYLNAMFKLNGSNKRHSNDELRKQLLCQALIGGSKINKPSESGYLDYLDKLFESGSDTVALVFPLALETYPDSLELMEKYLLYYIQIDDHSKIKEIFNVAKDKFGTDGYRFWDLYLKYLLTQFDADVEVEKLFKEAEEIDHSDFHQLKEQYSNWKNIGFMM